MRLSKNAINISSFTVAFAGIIYELGLAQILSATLGGTVLRYAVTIGLFTATLGLGALAFEYFIKKSTFEKIFPVFQNILAWIGLCSPWFLIGTHSESLILNHLPIVMIGFLSGIELPLLMSVSKPEHKGLVLSFDYLGMFTGTLLFPVILLPKFGVISTMLLASALNAIIGISFLKKQSFELRNFPLILVLVIDGVALFNQERIIDYASRLFI